MIHPRALSGRETVRVPARDRPVTCDLGGYWPRDHDPGYRARLSQPDLEPHGNVGEPEVPMPLPPSLSPEQRQAALDKAAAARRQRAELKEKLKMGSVSLPELLDQADRDEVVAKLKVVTVLESLPGVGKVKARRLMEDLEISESRRVRGLGAKQRQALLERFTVEA